MSTVSDKLDARLTFRVSPEEHEWLKTEAKRLDRSVSWLVRRMLSELLDEKREKGDGDDQDGN